MNPHLPSRLAAALLSVLVAACSSPGPTGPAVATAPAAAASAPAAVPGRFADNPIVYFLIPDRFLNGNPANDNAYGRQKDGLQEIGTFHGGDLKGVTLKLKEGWFKELGVNAIWITAPYEQIHGWVVGGNKAFKHYAYHGYYALDFTTLDKSMGTPEELREMVDTAHAQGIRILFDVVMNHPGYLDIKSAQDLGLDVLWPGAENATLTDYHGFIDYNNFNFGQWWGRDWVRAGLPGYIDGGRDDLTMQLAFLADFRTESQEAVKLPAFLQAREPVRASRTPAPAEAAPHRRAKSSGKARKPAAAPTTAPVQAVPGKPDTRARDLPNTTVRGYLVTWLSDWVREYGIDGFRADTVKHVEPEAWAALKAASTTALADWKARNPDKKIDDEPFWMVGEYWGQGPERTALHDSGFDALINFEFQTAGAQFARPESLYARYAQLLSGRPGYSTLSYLSSHDTSLFDRQQLEAGGAALMLAPGGVQIFYGDETARPLGPVPDSDPQQGTRSDMNWASPDTALLSHWRRLGSFRARHVALARGTHRQLADAPYTFSRIDAPTGDRVVVAMNAAGQQGIAVGDTFADGTAVRDAYSGQTGRVQAGRVTLASGAGRWVLLERAP
ncbi:alpha-amylase family glycosyl hydrolase [Rhizobacter sp. LjRoot28]